MSQDCYSNRVNEPNVLTHTKILTLFSSCMAFGNPYVI